MMKCKQLDGKSGPPSFTLTTSVQPMQTGPVDVNNALNNAIVRVDLLRFCFFLFAFEWQLLSFAKNR